MSISVAFTLIDVLYSFKVATYIQNYDTWPTVRSDVKFSKAILQHKMHTNRKSSIGLMTFLNLTLYLLRFPSLF